MKPASLAELQQWMLDYVTCPPHDSMARARLARDIPAWLRPSSRMPAAERLEVYREQYWMRLVKVVGRQFPRVAHQLGLKRFWQLVTAYAIEHPPGHFNVERLRDGFADFVDDPYLADVARLERAEADCFDAAEVALMRGDELERLWQSDACLRPAPASHLLAFEHDVISGGSGRPPREQTWVALSRRDYKMTRHVLGPRDYHVLRLLFDGATLSAVAARMASGAGTEHRERLRLTVRHWVEAGLFAAIDADTATCTPAR